MRRRSSSPGRRGSSSPARRASTPAKSPKATATPVPYVASVHTDAPQSICDAFSDDPLVRTFFPEDAEYRRVGPSMNRHMLWALGAYSMTEVCCDANGAVLSTACWEPATMSVGAIFRMLYTFAWLLGTLGVRKTALFGAVLFQLEAKRHRHAPTAHHLQLLGTSPAHQSKGLGATAMSAGIRRATSMGVPCYLESSNPKNVPFYKRHGFKIVEEYYHWEAEGGGDGDGELVKGRGPVATLMLRPLGTR